MLKSANLFYLVIHYYIKNLPTYILLVSLEKAEICILTQYNNISNLVAFFKRHTNTLVNVLIDITAADFPQKNLRFEVIYNCISMKYNSKIRFKIGVNEVMAISSLYNLYLSSNWLEREVWDLFGIFFFDHSRLRRILTDYGFSGYPLRKDFPGIGFYEVRYSETLQKVIYEPLEFASYLRFV